MPKISAAGSPAADRLAPSVLLVEDEFLIRLDLADAFRRAGWTVYEAASGEEAIHFLRSTIVVGLVLTDVRMPGAVDGTTLAGWVRRERPAVRVAVMSGHYEPSVEELSLWDAFFTKPAAPELLVKQLDELVDGTGQDAQRSPNDGGTQPAA
ncbi:response regulator [Mesorhizobium sp. BAC0120]|uniref:response regulator n=1 Tax=Mesorhizobium sp. BAC0120 TaxID=3090670 RepID=UPI00298C0009|nr:response regulator [Mesorhizobium sp. BAC0120]MDW6024581.1 response regulator [Mesorhizobium sp. BAC0120]